MTSEPKSRSRPVHGFHRVEPREPDTVLLYSCASSLGEDTLDESLSYGEVSLGDAGSDSLS